MAFGGYYYSKYQTLRNESAKTADERNEALIAMINEVYELPKDEKPVVAIVSDEAKFKEEYPVFTTAKLGDALLLFEKAGQAILFRESENRVIGTATFTVNRGASVHIIGSVEAQNATQTTLESKQQGKVTISSKATTTNQFTGVTVYDVSTTNGALASELAATLGGVVTTSAPAGENIPDGTDIVIVLGASSAQ
jgi:ATPase subunit of ABC transporter with duplicated ATPase domains